ncbi:MAG TPA: TlpA disulfide reductase family protein [Candidatus Acidoferrales bacterium]|jgi:thiol-disulfide isomerase/thioredoxin|nr:TlpA disulfide reductase family protein [Candidatus Acidoferrales bacterium]
MQKSLTPVIVSLVALAVFLVGFDATRERRAETLSSPIAVAHAAATTANAQPTVAPAKASSEDAPADAADGDSAKAIRFVRDPSPAPPFLLNDLSGNAISTAGYHGKVVLINFWATWCPPCREEIPEMIALASKYKDNLQIIGVSMDDDPPEQVLAFARAKNMNYPIVMGSDQLSEEYGGVDALPTTFVLDTNGRVVQKHMGVYPEEVYDGEIRALLGMHVDAPVETFDDTGQIFLKNVERATSLPGVDFSGLAPGLKKLALKRLNSEMCTCGCKMTIAQCRMTDPDCATSKALAAKIIREIKGAANPVAPNSTSAQNE